MNKVENKSFHFSISEQSSRLSVVDENSREVTSIACRIIGSSWIEKVQNFILTLFNWKWIHIPSLEEELQLPSDKRILVNLNSLAKNLGVDKNALRHARDENEAYDQISQQVKMKQTRIRKSEFIEAIKQNPIENFSVIETLNKFYTPSNSNYVNFKDGVSISDRNFRQVYIYYSDEQNKYLLGLHRPYTGIDPKLEIMATIYKEGENFYFTINAVSEVSNNVRTLRFLPKEVQNPVKEQISAILKNNEVTFGEL